MESLRVHNKSPKQANKTKKKPIRVVYISNPMRVRTSESEFSALVQKLTGRDSDVANNMEKYDSATVEIAGVIPPEAIKRPLTVFSNPGMNQSVMNNWYQSTNSTSFDVSDWGFGSYPSNMVDGLMIYEPETTG